MGTIANKYGPPATVKDAIMDLLRESGYDFMTAAEIATARLAEFKASGRRETTIECAAGSVTIRNNNVKG